MKVNRDYTELTRDNSPLDELIKSNKRSKYRNIRDQVNDIEFIPEWLRPTFRNLLLNVDYVKNNYDIDLSQELSKGDLCLVLVSDFEINNNRKGNNLIIKTSYVFKYGILQEVRGTDYLVRVGRCYLNLENTGADIINKNECDSSYIKGFFGGLNKLIITSKLDVIPCYSYEGEPNIDNYMNYLLDLNKFKSLYDAGM